MDKNTVTENAEIVNTEVKVETPAVVPVSVQELAEGVVAVLPILMVRPTESKDYRILGTVAKSEMNWRKGLIYQVLSYSKGLILEAQLYSVKKGAHLAEYKGKFEALITEEIQCLPKGLACRLKIKLPLALGKDGMVAKAVEFINLVEPHFEEVRELLKDEDFLSKKEIAALAKAAAPAKVEEPAAEAPATEPAVTEPTAEAPAPTVVKQAAKKNHGKRK